MIRLRLFGGAALERDGRPVTGRAAQRHPMALLALLAVSPGRTASRDKLIACLWPDSPTARARHRLSVALHTIRRELGAEALDARSDGVALAGVHTDVDAFGQALAGGRLEEAVAIHAGPFLDGFFLGGAAAFEEWVASARNGFADRYAGALERLAREADERGDAAAAAGWWRKLTLHDPCSTPFALGLIGALHSAGDRTGALRHARAHAAFVPSEIGVPPEPAILDVARELAAAAETRSSPPPSHGADARLPAAHGAAPSAPAAPAAPTRQPSRVQPWHRVSLLAAAGLAAVLLVAWGMALPARRGAGAAAPPAVVVLPFAGADAELGASLAQRVAETLAAVPGLRIETGGGQAANGDEALAARAGRALGAGLVVTGIVSRKGPVVTATVSLVDARTDARLWTDSFDHPFRDADRFLTEASLAIALDLRLRVAPYQPKVYTENERAYDRFLQGVYAQRRMTQQDIWKALQFYREGYEEDERFALAHAISANAYLNLIGMGVSAEVGVDQARHHALESLAIDSTLAEGHAALGVIQISYDRDFSAGERSLRRALILYPTLPQAHSSYGFHLLRTRDSPDIALSHIRRALEVDPLNAARSHVIERALYLARRYDDVIAQHQVTRAIAPDRDFTFHGSPLGDAYRALGRYDEAIVEYRRIQKLTGAGPAHGLAVAYARTGRLDSARAVLRELEARAGGGAAAQLALAYAAIGDVDRAFHWLEEADAKGAALMTLRVEPDLDALRGDPRYEDLRQRLGLAPASTSGARR